MKYCTYSLKWENDYGTDPTQFNSDDVRFEPTFTDKPIANNNNAKIYAYWIKGTLDSNILIDFNFEEITLQQMFEAAQILDPNCWIENDRVKFPFVEHEVIPNGDN